MRKRVTKETIDSLLEDGLSFVRFYQNVAAEFQMPVMESTIFDCRKILVASNIINHWYGQVREKYGKGGTDVLTREICIFGPKTAEDFADDEVELQRGFLTEAVS